MRALAYCARSAPVFQEFRGQHGCPRNMDLADKTKALCLLQILLRFVLEQDLRIIPCFAMYVFL